MSEDEILENDQLNVGSYYHCFGKETGRHSIEECGQHGNDPKFMGNGIWAEDDNSRALQKWMIFGPIAIPKIETIGLCQDHHGHGFKSDCSVCKAN